MTENEAVEYLLSRYLVVGSPVNPPKEECEKHNDVLDLAITALEAIKAYRAIGTIEEFKALKEKNEPKKPQEISWGATKCPICGQEFGFNSHFNHCSNCGQKLDWQ